jgi:hypothetical protein
MRTTPEGASSSSLCYRSCGVEPPIPKFAAGHPPATICVMRYLVKARVKPGKETALLAAIRDGSLGRGSIAGDEYRHNMEQARLAADGTVSWVEVCFCAEPLDEERPYWEEFFELLAVKDAHARANCRHENGTEPWACGDCDCTRRLEEKLLHEGKPFLENLPLDHPRRSSE